MGSQESLPTRLFGLFDRFFGEPDWGGGGGGGGGTGDVGQTICVDERDRGNPGGRTTARPCSFLSSFSFSLASLSSAWGRLRESKSRLKWERVTDL